MARERRLVIYREGKYEVLKPVRENPRRDAMVDCNSVGRRYSKRGIINYCSSPQMLEEYDILYSPKGLENVLGLSEKAVK